MMSNEQNKDKYTWEAVYKDDTAISEFDYPEGRGFADVDKDRVKELYIVGETQELRGHVVLVPDGAQPVFFRRRYMAIKTSDRTIRGVPTLHNAIDASDLIATVHCIGWKRDDKAVYLFVFEDGSSMLSDDLQAV